jgi:phosphinothricin acetyltransferase
MTAADWPVCRRIYQEGLDTNEASFETVAPDWEAFDGSRSTSHRFVAMDGERVVGWVAVSPVSERCVYAGVVELSVYVDPAARGRGVGRLLVDALLASTDAGGVWTVQGGVFPENAASLGLHVAAGFRVVGTRERLGLMTHGPLAGKWRDVVLLERRSSLVD